MIRRLRQLDADDLDGVLALIGLVGTLLFGVVVLVVLYGLKAVMG